MKFITTTSFVILVITSVSFPQSNWEWQYSTTTEDLYDVHFVNKDNGWVIGNNGIILHTNDSGLNWYKQNSGTTKRLNAVHFLNDQSGWIIGDQTILYTQDGGMNWDKYFQGVITDVTSIFFVNENDGWLCGSDKVILKTANGGGTWEAIPSEVGNFDEIFFINEKIGWVHSSDDAGYIFMTDDGGYTLNPMSRSRKSFKSFFFLDTKNAWACGGLVGEVNKLFGWIDISSDGADNWNSQFEQGLMHSIHFFDQYHGIALGQRNRGVIINKIYDIFLKTVDGGETWEASEPGGNAFHFIEPDTGWLVGYNGKIYKTTNGGGILNTSAENNNLISKFKLMQNYPNPFNPRTIINYELQITNDVELSVYNLLGQKIVTLVSERQKAGHHHIEWNASGFPSGVYYYMINTGKFHDVKKMILLR